MRRGFNEAVGCDTNRTPLAYVNVTEELDQVDVNLEPNKTIVLLQNQVIVIARWAIFSLGFFKILFRVIR